MKRIRKLLKDDFNSYFKEYKKVKDYNFSNTEKEELKEFSIEDDFIYFTLQEIYNNSSLKFRRLLTELDLTDDILELFKGVNKKQLYINYWLFEKLIIDYFKQIDINDHYYKF